MRLWMARGRRHQCPGWRVRLRQKAAIAGERWAGIDRLLKLGADESALSLGATQDLRNTRAEGKVSGRHKLINQIRIDLSNQGSVILNYGLGHHRSFRSEDTYKLASERRSQWFHLRISARSGLISTYCSANCSSRPVA